MSEARRDALDALILCGAEPEGAEATILAIEAEAVAPLRTALEQMHTRRLEVERRQIETDRERRERLRQIHAAHDVGHAAGAWPNACMGCQMYRALLDASEGSDER